MKKQIFKTLFMTTLISQMSFLGINALGAESESLQKDKIKIDIVSDVVCPWCAIGYKRLSQAINEMKLEDKVKIVWHPFELNPNMPREGQNADKYLMNKLRLNKEELKQTRNRVTKLGEKSGFKFDYFKEMRKLNTLNAHILLDYAKKFNKQTKLKVRLQEAYFSERKNISNRDVLFLELQEVGLNAKEAIATLDDNNAISHIKEEEEYWKERGVFSIPTMIFNDSLVRVGANEVDTYKQILAKIVNEKK